MGTDRGMDDRLLDRMLSFGSAVLGITLFGAAIVRLSEPLEDPHAFRQVRVAARPSPASRPRRTVVIAAHQVVRTHRASPPASAIAQPRPVVRLALPVRVARVPHAAPLVLLLTPPKLLRPHAAHGAEPDATPEPPIGYDQEPELAGNVDEEPVAADLPDSFRLQIPKRGRRSP